MLQYLIILLDDTSTTYCHCDNPKHEANLMPLETLKKGIRFGMMENLMIQFVYPDYEMTQVYKDTVETIDHSKIVSSLTTDEELADEADVIVLHDWMSLQYYKFKEDKAYVLRTDKANLFDRFAFLKSVLGKVSRLNVVVTDVEAFTDGDFERYNHILSELATEMKRLYVAGKSPQLNLLTDRIMLKEMNNCGAGESNITLAPNGKFYVCPAFYYENEKDSVGDLEHGLDIKNKQLYRLDHAPICRHCDAYQCKRCIWLNRKTTLEVNTPSHEQCVVAHMERNASRELLQKIGKCKNPLWHDYIEEIDYLDPFEKYQKI